ncbi:MAG: hypothetical protein R3D26_05640 [Cyanobacteriota/Melainabacteria group bacterium]
MDSKSQNLILIALLSLIIGATFISVGIRHFGAPEHSKTQQNNLVQRVKDTKHGAALTEALQKLADEGNPVAARELAELYLDGKEVPRDFHLKACSGRTSCQSQRSGGAAAAGGILQPWLANSRDENKAIDINAEAASLGSKKQNSSAP